MNILTHEEIYRTEELIKKISNASITVCGCGALGSNLIDNMVRQGFSNITVIDMDRIEGHNRSTQIWETRDIGNLKAEKMKQKAYSATGTQIISIAKELNESNIEKFLRYDSTIIDTFDNTKSRTLVYGHCKKNNIKCLHIGMHSDYAEIIWNEYYTVPQTNTAIDVCEYPLARNIILLAVAVGTETLIKYINENKKYNYAITLRDMKTSKLNY